MTLKNFAAETCTISGTTATLTGAYTGYNTLLAAGAVNGGSYSYGLQDYDPATGVAISSEGGTAVYNSVPNTLTLTVTDSTNGGASIVITKSARIYITALSADILTLGTSAGNAAAGNHAHAGVYEPADATILKSGNASWIDLTDGGGTTLHTHAYEPIDSTIVRTGQTNWIDLTDGGATTLHSHSAYLTSESDPAHAAWLAATRAANTFPAGPASGADAALSWRALVAADIPALSYEPTISILSAERGGTGVNNGTFNLTVPATGTAALLGTANVFTIGGQMVDSSADAIELRLQAHSSKTTNFLTWEKSDGTVFGGVDNRGILFSHGGIDVDSVYIGNSGKVGATGIANVGIGKNSFIALTSGSYCVGFGYDALKSLTSGNFNFGLGYASLTRVSSGSGNVGAGSGTLGKITTTGGNTAMGNYTLANATGSNNTAVGSNAGEHKTSGDGAIFIGYAAGYNQTTGSYIFIVDSILRSSVATELTNSILCGIMASSPYDQTLRVNAVTSIMPGYTAAGVKNVLILDATGSGANGDGGSIPMAGKSSTTASTAMALIDWRWINATHATRTAALRLYAYDTAARLGLEIEASGTAPEIAFFGGTTAIQQVLNAYTSDGEGSAYSGIDNLQAGSVYAQLSDLNQLRAAYENLRSAFDDMRTKLITSTLIA